jgi:hypothetical protein
MMQLDTVTFSNHLVWEDEYEWEPVQQAQGEYNVDGALDIQIEANVKQAGRKITLKGARNYGLVQKSTVDALKALSAVPGKIMTLTLPDAREFNVMFDGEKRVVATPVFKRNRYRDTDWFILELYLIEVPE